VDGAAFAEQRGDVQRFAGLDDADGAFRCEQVGEVVPVLGFVGDAEDVVWGFEVQFLELGGEVLAVVDDVVGAEGSAPFGGFRARGGGDDGEVGELGGELSNSISQAVSEVSGRAAASAKERVLGLRPVMRSSTRWNSALVPGRLITPA
jgi:hypothetical protein